MEPWYDQSKYGICCMLYPGGLCVLLRLVKAFSGNLGNGGIGKARWPQTVQYILYGVLEVFDKKLKPCSAQLSSAVLCGNFLGTIWLVHIRTVSVVDSLTYQLRPLA